MKKADCITWLTISAAIGAAAGFLSNPGKPKHSVFTGAAVGIIAGSLTTAFCRLLKKGDDGINYYTKSSPLYENSEDSTDL